MERIGGYGSRRNQTPVTDAAPQIRCTYVRLIALPTQGKFDFSEKSNFFIADANGEAHFLNRSFSPSVL